LSSETIVSRILATLSELDGGETKSGGQRSFTDLSSDMNKMKSNNIDLVYLPSSVDSESQLFMIVNKVTNY